MMFDRILLKPCWHTAVETGTVIVRREGDSEASMQRSRFARENARKYQGIKPSHLDFYVFQPLPMKRTHDGPEQMGPAGLYVQIELKIGTKESANQTATRNALAREGIQSATCRTLQEVHDFIKGLGFRLHPNSSGILFELQQHYEAACRAAKLKAPGAKSYKPHVVKAEAGRLRKVERIRATGIRI